MTYGCNREVLKLPKNSCQDQGNQGNLTEISGKIRNPIVRTHVYICPSRVVPTRVTIPLFLGPANTPANKFPGIATNVAIK